MLYQSLTAPLNSSIITCMSKKTGQKRSRWEQYKPGVHKHWLLLIAGLLWFGVGCMLNGFALTWLRVVPGSKGWILGGTGFLCGLIIHHFGFLKIVDKNLARILPVEGKRCVFSFMPWKSYGMILVMSLMGATLRHSALPKPTLAILYCAMGTALALSSIRYFRYLFKTINA